MGRWWTVICIGLWLLTGCGDQGVPAEKPDIVGIVTDVQDQSFLLQAEESLIRAGDVYRVAITDRTAVYQQKADRATKAEIDDIKQVRRVSLWVDGSVRESNPPGVSAKVVLLQEEE